MLFPGFFRINTVCFDNFRAIKAKFINFCINLAYTFDLKLILRAVFLKWKLFSQFIPTEKLIVSFTHSSYMLQREQIEFIRVIIANEADQFVVWEQMYELLGALSVCKIAEYNLRWNWTAVCNHRVLNAFFHFLS